MYGIIHYLYHRVHVLDRSGLVKKEYLFREKTVNVA